ncbi:MAG: sugar ABC transporter permease [Lachnospiraceae bacterium]|nr:sugar ABC transporter permease [Robinsoniella sp.]MDY3767173.1 sugar ABC transporter permease [Lachnospiraceae bacterium]
MKEQNKNKVRRKKGSLKQKEALMGYLFILPWLIGVLIFVLRPLVQSFGFALSKVKMTPKGRISTFIGLQNFTQILQEDETFPTELGAYLIKTIIAVPVIVVFALIIALLLNSKIKGKGVFRLIFFLPVIIASGPVMTQLVDQGAGSIPSINTSAISSMISFLPGILEDAIMSVFENIVMYLWYSGVQILIFLAAVQKIDTSLYEAAKMDGGSTWECFWKITLPTIKPMILLNAVYTVVFLSNNEQNTIITTIKDAMFGTTGSKGYGYASAMAWLYALVVTLLVAAVAAFLVMKKDVYQKQAKKVRKAQKKEERLLKKLERRGEKYEQQKLKKAAR